MGGLDEQGYVEWLREQSMLETAGKLAGRFLASGDFP